MMQLFYKHRSRCALLALLAITPVFGGCYGRFPLTKAVYKFNGEVSDNEFVVQIVFWVFGIILPVYGIAAFGDVIIFNLIEFWTGSTLEMSSVTRPDGSVVTLAPSEDGKTAILTVTKDGKVLETRSFVRVNDTTVEMKDAQGVVVGSVVKENSGGLTFNDAAGFEVKTVSAKEVAAVAAK